MRGFLARRVARPVAALLGQGLTPSEIALSLAVGLAVGVFPVAGTTTLLGLAIGVSLRLSQPALQLANWLTYPLQLLLIVPFVRLGEWLAGAGPASFTPSQVIARFSSDPVEAVAAFGVTGLHGILGWLAVLPFLVLGLYRLWLPVLASARQRQRRAVGVSGRRG